MASIVLFTNLIHWLYILFLSNYCTKPGFGSYRKYIKFRVSFIPICKLCTVSYFKFLYKFMDYFSNRKC